jgi:hypothetical protein
MQAEIGQPDKQMRVGAHKDFPENRVKLFYG